MHFLFFTAPLAPSVSYFRPFLSSHIHPKSLSLTHPQFYCSFKIFPRLYLLLSCFSPFLAPRDGLESASLCFNGCPLPCFIFSLVCVLLFRVATCHTAGFLLPFSLRSLVSVYFLSLALYFLSSVSWSSSVLLHVPRISSLVSLCLSGVLGRLVSLLSTGFAVFSCISLILLSRLSCFLLFVSFVSFLFFLFSEVSLLLFLYHSSFSCF